MEGWEGKDHSESLLRSNEKLPPPLQPRKRSPPALERVRENGEGDSSGHEAEEAGEESSSESSDSGSSNTSTSSSGTTSTSGDAHSSINPVWSGNFQMDEFGEFFTVTCNNNDAKFYLSRFARGSIGRCVLFRGRWITPNEFQAVSGRQSSKDWKRSIRLNGRCLKEYIAQGMFHEHQKACACRICSGEDTEHLRQEGEMALAAKRRRLSQADPPGLSTQPLPEDAGKEEEPEGKPPPVKKRRGRPPKVQRVWSPSGEAEAAPEGSSNDDEYKPGVLGAMEGEDPANTSAVIDASDFLPRRSRRSTHQKQVGHRTELGTFTHKPAEWDVEEVSEFMRLQGYVDYAETFQENDIDGKSLFLLREHHLLEQFSMKLGPALRLLDTISRLRHPPIA